MWGNDPDARHRHVRSMNWRLDDLPLLRENPTVLPHGLGRSYGDSCLNEGGTLLDTTRLNHMIDFHRETGLLP